ncbi:NAD(FAD)-utilizing dehydrogenase [Thiosulfatimonas sediminis]|uniref:NAD(FAD)-utilizing dehydrogenase n=1 Tax=Thiosulfatimonas sediminis TaxID=2675054 RepID=A0A6F8PUJ9_9GAMM|nr:TIGR03862 family flavoprotein [Thiosulfatimonas sediminis]BBP45694.1 NAD(FAD)-utilizing dehydrogenase [Thiosulfatimonas sediminis]
MSVTSFSIAIIGAGPAGLMAADLLSQAGCQVTVYDAMPSAGRKLLQAGRGGFNLTHSEPYDDFIGRYTQREQHITPWLQQFNADDVRLWAEQLGVATYIGSSGRVYPTNMQAAPLLRAWLQRMKLAGVTFKMRHRWLGWTVDGAMQLQHLEQTLNATPSATVLAMGGASWPRLGSDGAWVKPLREAGIEIAPLLPANCGFNLLWSDIFKQRFAGLPIKNVRFSYTDLQGITHSKLGEAMLTEYGLEGSLVYALSAGLRDQIQQTKKAVILYADLMPDHSLDALKTRFKRGWAKKGKASLASLFKKLGLSNVQVGLLREVLSAEQLQDADTVAHTLKQLPLALQSTRPIDEVISSAGGITFDALDANLMLKQKPGVFCAGEMLDWEAPTGGYLLTAVLASGKVVANGVLDYLNRQ